MSDKVRTGNGVIVIFQVDRLMIADYSLSDFQIIPNGFPVPFSICPDQEVNLKIQTTGGSIGVFKFFPGWSNPISVVKIFNLESEGTQVQIGY